MVNVDESMLKVNRAEICDCVAEIESSQSEGGYDENKLEERFVPFLEGTLGTVCLGVSSFLLHLL